VIDGVWKVRELAMYLLMYQKCESEPIMEGSGDSTILSSPEALQLEPFMPDGLPAVCPRRQKNTRKG